MEERERPPAPEIPAPPESQTQAARQPETRDMSWETACLFRHPDVSSSYKPVRFDEEMLASGSKDGGNRILWHIQTYKIGCGLIAWEVISRRGLAFVEPEMAGDTGGGGGGEAS